MATPQNQTRWAQDPDREDLDKRVFFPIRGCKAIRRCRLCWIGVEPRIGMMSPNDIIMGGSAPCTKDFLPCLTQRRIVRKTKRLSNRGEDHLNPSRQHVYGSSTCPSLELESQPESICPLNKITQRSKEQQIV